MARTTSKAGKHIHYHKDGSIWAKGELLDLLSAGRAHDITVLS